MCEIYSEVSAILSSNVICAMEGCVTEALRNCVHTTGVKVLSENNMQYLLSGSLGGIIAAEKELQNLLKTLKLAETCRKCTDITNDIHYLTSTSTNCENEFSGVSETDNNENVAINTCERNGNLQSLENPQACLKPPVKKLRFMLRERPPRLKWSKLMRRCINPKKRKVLKRHGDESEMLRLNLEQMKLSTENSSDCDSKLNTDSSREEVGHKKCKDYEVSSPYKYFCDLCSFKTKRGSHFTKHMAIHEKVSTLYKCSQCSFTSIRLSHLRRHEISHSSTLHACSQCHYKTDDSKFLLRHVRLKHNGGHRDKFPMTLNCSQCSYQTTKEHYFERHKRMHCSKERNPLHQCDKCSYKTHRKEHYVRHMNNVHCNKRPYLCHLCGKAFKRGDALQQHHQTHTDIKKLEGSTFKCGLCDKVFRSQSHLTEHKAVHSIVRSFLCEICGACFKTRSVQRKHVATIHRNPRAYSCSACPKRFNTLYGLKRHQTKVHNAKSSSRSVLEQESEVDTDDVAKVMPEEPLLQASLREANVGTIAELIRPVEMADDGTIPVTDVNNPVNTTFRPLPLQQTVESTVLDAIQQESQPEVVVSSSELIQLPATFFQPPEMYLSNGIVPF